MTSCDAAEESFLKWLSERRRPECSLQDLLLEAGGPEKCAVLVVDLLEGFCRQGPLASPLVEALIDPICRFLRQAHLLGVTRFYFPSDSHDPDSSEFLAFPPHCLEGSEESRLVRELRELEFSHLFERIDKNSVSSLIGTSLVDRLKKDELKTVICVGDCTDLCLYHLAVGLRFVANNDNLDWQVVVPQNLVATYDLPVETAEEIGALPHPAAFMGKMFLYHLELNGVRVVGLEV